MDSLRGPLTALALASAWIVAQTLSLPFLAAAVAVAALWATAAAAPVRGRRLHLALGAIVVPIGVGLLLLLGPFRSGLPALLVEAAMVAILAPLAPLLYAWTFAGRSGTPRS